VPLECRVYQHLGIALDAASMIAPCCGCSLLWVALCADTLFDLLSAVPVGPAWL
jgi:hypothetical protein